jgi:hypothetical protein
VTRIDMTTRAWHELLKPVVPHTLADGDWPELARIRIEVGERSVVAVATDKLSLGAERHTLAPAAVVYDPPRPIAIQASEAKATLSLFTYSKDDDPPLRITIDNAPVPITLAGEDTAVDCQALTIEDRNGRRVVLRDCLDPSRDPLANWRAMLRAALRRETVAAPPALCLHAGGLARWVQAVRKGERLAIYTGNKPVDDTDEDAPRKRGAGSNVLLVLVEDHFAGLWVPATYLDGPEQILAGPEQILAESPWRHELWSLHDRDVDEVVKRATERVAAEAAAGFADAQPDDPALD